MKLTLASQRSDARLKRVIKVLRGETMGSFIDLACGDALITRTLPSSRAVYVDLLRRENHPKNFVLADLTEDHPIFMSRFHTAFCLNGLYQIVGQDPRSPSPSPQTKVLTLLKRIERMSDQQILLSPGPVEFKGSEDYARIEWDGVLVFYKSVNVAERFKTAAKRLAEDQDLQVS